MQSEADAFNEWAHNNGLLIKRKKTFGMLFCSKSMKAENLPNIKIHKTTCLHNFQVNCDCKLCSLRGRRKDELIVNFTRYSTFIFRFLSDLVISRVEFFDPFLVVNFALHFGCGEIINPICSPEKKGSTFTRGDRGE
jgi:hypothetical protein